MWNARRILSLLACLLLSPAAAPALEVPANIKGRTTWQGEVVLRQTVTVEKGAVLTIAPGTTVKPLAAEAKLVVHGSLQVKGTPQANVVFAGPAGWQGIEFFQADPGSRLEHARFDKAQVAIGGIEAGFALRNCTFRNCDAAVKLLREASPTIEECLFVGNTIGIDNEMKSSVTVRRNRFLEHKTTAILASHNSVGAIEGNTFERNKQGIGLIQKYPDRVTGNRFVDNEVGIYCNQTQNTPQIKGNTFEKNKIALVNFSFAYPQVEENIFVGNETAIRNDQYGSPQVAHNLFRANKTALYNYRKSNPVVEQNLVEKNDLALFCDFSSYPRVKNNNFLGNRMGVELGIYQSADWEKRVGSKGIVQEAAAERQSQNPLLAQAPTEFRDIVDVSGNWWGDDTQRLAAAGKDANLPFFFDRKDKPKVVYEGYGQESYILDRIVYSPWLAAPVRDAGPAGKK